MSIYSMDNGVQILPQFVQASICKHQQQLLMQFDVRYDVCLENVLRGLVLAVRRDYVKFAAGNCSRQL